MFYKYLSKCNVYFEFDLVGVLIKQVSEIILKQYTLLKVILNGKIN